MTKEVTVSITCITYNHEKFIADAIESFLMQKTDFAYEILIHDYASTKHSRQNQLINSSSYRVVANTKLFFS